MTSAEIARKLKLSRQRVSVLTKAGRIFVAPDGSVSVAPPVKKSGPQGIMKKVCGDQGLNYRETLNLKNAGGLHVADFYGKQVVFKDPEITFRLEFEKLFKIPILLGHTMESLKDMTVTGFTEMKGIGLGKATKMHDWIQRNC